MSAPVATLPPLATIADLEAYLGHPVDPVTGAAALDMASGWVRAYCGWTISLQTGVTFVCDGTGTCLLDLPTMHLVDVHEVRLGIDVLVNDPTDVEGYDWSRAGQLWRDAGWPERMRNVEVDCDHGYDPVPQALVGAVCAVAGRHIVNPSNVRMQTVGTVIEQFHDPAQTIAGMSGTPATVVLDMFRLPMKP